MLALFRQLIQSVSDALKDQLDPGRPTSTSGRGRPMPSLTSIVRDSVGA
jgi:hypothetical protein